MNCYLCFLQTISGFQSVARRAPFVRERALKVNEEKACVRNIITDTARWTNEDVHLTVVVQFGCHGSSNFVVTLVPRHAEFEQNELFEMNCKTSDWLNFLVSMRRHFCFTRDRTIFS